MNGYLAANVQEVAICTVGAFYHSKFEFSTHSALAIKAGVSESSLKSLRDGEDPGFEGDELLSYHIARQMLTAHGISDETYGLGLVRIPVIPITRSGSFRSSIAPNASLVIVSV